MFNATKTISNFEIIIVDDASADKTVSIALQYDVKVLKSTDNCGPGATRNRGVENAKGNILVFVDADIVVASDALVRIEEHFKQDTSCAAVIGSYDDEPQVNTLISKYRNLLHHYVHQHSSENASHFWTGLGAIRRSIFHMLGGFNEKEFGRAIEDVELGYRMRANGYNIRLDKNIRCKHLKHWTLTSMVRTDLFIRAIPWTHLLILYKNLPNDFSLGWLQRISVFLSGMVFAFLLLSLIHPMVMYIFALSLIGFVIANFSFFKFLAVHNSILMSAACVPLHLLYNFNAGIGFVLGILSYYIYKLVNTKENNNGLV